MQCPQARLPLACAENRNLRNASTIALAVVGFTLCFTGAILQAVGLGGLGNVPSEKICGAYSLQHTGCDVVTASTQFPCCHGNVEPSTQIWSYDTSFSQLNPNYGMCVGALSLSLGDAKTFFHAWVTQSNSATWIKNSEGWALSPSGPTTLGSQHKIMPFRIMDKDFATGIDSTISNVKNHATASSVQWANLYKAQAAALSGVWVGEYVDLAYSLIFCWCFTISSFINMTFACRQGFARANIAFGATTLAVILMSYWSTISIIVQAAPLSTSCTLISNDNAALYVPAEFSSTRTVTGKGARLLNMFPCYDVSCAYQENSSDGTHVCEHKKNPLLEFQKNKFITFLDGQWVFFAGLVVSVAVLANIGPFRGGNNEQSGMRKNSFAMAAPFQ